MRATLVRGENDDRRLKLLAELFGSSPCVSVKVYPADSTPGFVVYVEHPYDPTGPSEIFVCQLEPQEQALSRLEHWIAKEFPGKRPHLDISFYEGLHRVKTLDVGQRRGILSINQTEMSTSVTLISGSRSLGTTSADMVRGRGCWMISRCFVHPNHRGKGIGAILITHLIATTTLGSDFVELTVAPGGYGSDAQRLDRFYLRHGFERTKEEGLLRLSRR